MTRENFRHLIEAFCKLSGLDDPGRILDGGAILVNDETFSLIYSDSVNPGVVFIYCDFGDVPVNRRAEAYRMLLEANLYLYTGNGPAFTISSDTGRVLYADQFRLEKNSSPERLHTILIDIAAKAVAWRADYFLQNPSRHGGRVSSGRLPGLNR